MNQSNQKKIANLLGHIAEGDTSAEEFLLLMIYDELLLITKQRIDYAIFHHHLVAEVFVRLDQNQTLAKSANRTYFFAAIAKAMRRVLVDSARRPKSQGAVGDLERETSDNLSISRMDKCPPSVCDEPQKRDRLSRRCEVPTICLLPMPGASPRAATSRCGTCHPMLSLRAFSSGLYSLPSMALASREIYFGEPPHRSRLHRSRSKVVLDNAAPIPDHSGRRRLWECRRSVPPVSRSNSLPRWSNTPTASDARRCDDTCSRNTLL